LSEETEDEISAYDLLHCHFLVDEAAYILKIKRAPSEGLGIKLFNLLGSKPPGRGKRVIFWRASFSWVGSNR